MTSDFIPKGFAFSVDVVLALILVSAISIIITLPQERTSLLEERRVADQYVDDIFLAMDHSGFITNEIDTNGFASTTLQNIYSHIRNLLPAQYDFYIQLKSYPVDVNACRISQDFESCFPDINTSTLTNGTALPTNSPFIHGRRVFLKQQPASQCSTNLAPADDWITHLFQSGPLAFQTPPDLNTQFDVNVSPSGPLTCDQNISVTLSVTTNQGTRQPVDMVLVFDRSGSMSWNGQLSTTNGTGIEVSGDNAYIADGTGGLRDVNAQRPGLLSLRGTYNSPGSANDVDVNGNYAYLADGSSGLRIVNITNPSSPSSVAQLDVGGTAYGVWSRDTTTYIATYSASSKNITTTSSSPNQLLYVGRSSSQASAGQSFNPTIDFISGFGVRLRKIGNPPTITAHLRTSINGADLNTLTISAASVSTASGGAYVDLNFSGTIPLTSGTAYFIVLTTPSNSSSNYYEWQARGSNPYSGGQAYQNSTAQTWDAFLQTFYIPGLITVDTSTKNSPRVMGATDLNDAYHVTLAGNYAYAANGTRGFRIFDITNPKPLLIGNCYNQASCNISSGVTYDVWVNTTTAYVSNGTAGLRIIDISNPSNPQLLSTHNTPGTAYTTRLKDTNAVVLDASSLQLIDISNPSSPVLMGSFSTPYGYRDLEIQNNWAYIALNSGIDGIMTIDLSTGPKINQAKVAAQTFIDFNGWNDQSDQMGLVSYASSSTLDRNLTSNFPLVKTAVNNLVSSGGTATGDGINTATNELISARANPTALKFQVLMSDGQTNSGSSSNTAAITASNNNIIIYTIGFGEDADEVELQNIANQTGGQYYAASDQNSLAAVYQLIAQSIQVLAQDANIIANFSNGTLIVNDGNAMLNGTNLIFDINTLSPQPWIAAYTFMIPCTSQLACSSSLISVPGAGTSFQYLDINGNPQVLDWNEFVTQSFNYRDLNLEILSGNIIGSGNVDLTVQVSSQGNLDTNSVPVDFYQGNPSPATYVNSATIPYLCGAQSPGCSNPIYSFVHNVPAEGELYAVVNPNSSVPECKYNNQDVLYCYTRPETRFFTLDYWAWIRS